jgi:hypothetical protein
MTGAHMMAKSGVITRSAITLTTLLALACPQERQEIKPTEERVHLTCQASQNGMLKGFQVQRSTDTNILLQGIAVPQSFGAPVEVFPLAHGDNIAYHNGTWYTKVKQPCGKSEAYVWLCSADETYQNAACGSLVKKP